MQVNCDTCSTPYYLSERQVALGVFTCDACGAVCQIQRPPGKEWQIQRSSGEILVFQGLATLQEWIVTRKVFREDQISRSGQKWKRLGEIPELQPFFEEAERRRVAAALRVKPAYEPPAPTLTMPTALPRRSGAFEQVRAVNAQEPAVVTAPVVLSRPATPLPGMARTGSQPIRVHETPSAQQVVNTPRLPFATTAPPEPRAQTPLGMRIHPGKPQTAIAENSPPDEPLPGEPLQTLKSRPAPPRRPAPNDPQPPKPSATPFPAPRGAATPPPGQLRSLPSSGYAALARQAPAPSSNYSMVRRPESPVMPPPKPRQPEPPTPTLRYSEADNGRPIGLSNAGGAKIAEHAETPEERTSTMRYGAQPSAIPGGIVPSPPELPTARVEAQPARSRSNPSLSLGEARAPVSSQAEPFPAMPAALESTPAPYAATDPALIATDLEEDPNTLLDEEPRPRLPLRPQAPSASPSGEQEPKTVEDLPGVRPWSPPPPIAPPQPPAAPWAEEPPKSTRRADSSDPSLEIAAPRPSSAAWLVAGLASALLAGLLLAFWLRPAWIFQDSPTPLAQPGNAERLRELVEAGNAALARDSEDERERARTDFAGALGVEKDHPPALAGLLLLYATQAAQLADDRDLAQRSADRLAASGNEDEIATLKANIALLNSEEKKARDQAQRYAEKLSPLADEPYAVAAAAEYFWAIGDEAQRKDRLARLRDLDPKAWQLDYLDALAQLRDPLLGTQAEEQLRQLLKQHPELIRARYLLARHLEEQGRRPEAIAEAEEILRQNPAHERAARVLARAKQPASEPSSEPELPAPGDPTKTPEEWTKEGNRQLKRGKLNDALTSYLAATSIAPNHLPALLGAGDVYLRQELLDQACASYYAAYRLDSSAERAIFGLGECSRSPNTRDEAIARYREYLQKFPSGAQAQEAKRAITALEKAAQKESSAKEDPKPPRDDKKERQN